MRNVILTGVPRSGTSLVCQLLDKCADTVAVSEPPISIMDNTSPMNYSHAEIVCGIEEYFQNTRSLLVDKGIIVSHNINGLIPDNYFEPYRTDSKVRTSSAKVGTVCIDKPLSSDFTLCIKHPAPFTALLATLTGRFPCYAIIRNPLAILASWNSVNVPIGISGHIPAAERLDIDLEMHLKNMVEKNERQMFLLDWFFRQYQKFLPKENILPYEKIIKQPDELLSIVTPNAKQLISVELNNRNKVYDKTLIMPLAERLLNSDGAYWSFYSKNDVADILSICD